MFRLGASGRTLGYAAAGYLEGTVILGDPGTTAPAPRPPAWPRRAPMATATA